MHMIFASTAGRKIQINLGSFWQEQDLVQKAYFCTLQTQTQNIIPNGRQYFLYTCFNSAGRVMFCSHFRSHSINDLCFWYCQVALPTFVRETKRGRDRYRRFGAWPYSLSIPKPQRRRLPQPYISRWYNMPPSLELAFLWFSSQFFS